MAPWAAAGKPAAHAVAAGASVAAALLPVAARGGQPALEFVPAASLPPGQAYEAHIAATGGIPTRDNLHDFFNGLAWHAFPATKRQLNRLQAAEIAGAGVGAVRGPVRDAITTFDENGALLSAPDILWQALAARDWHALFVVHRATWDQARLQLFGHALLEKLVAPRKAMTAHVLRLPESVLPDAVDTWLAARLHAPFLASKPFVPLPVLGVPGWCPANARPDFYADTRVFRPPRPRER